MEGITTTPALTTQPPKTPRSKVSLAIVIFLFVVAVAVAGLDIYKYWWQSGTRISLDVSSGHAAGTVTIVLQSSASTVAPGQSVSVDITMNTGASSVTATELHLSVSGQATIQALVKGDFLPQELAAPVTTGTAASIIVGSGTTARIGTGRIATLTLQASQTAGTATVSVSAGTQVSAVGFSSDVLSALPNPVSITVAQVSPPTVQISASPTTIKTGSMVPAQKASSVLTWITTNATSVSINQSIGTVGISGTRSVTPATATTYTITATNAGGSTTGSATVQVAKVDDIALPAGKVDIYDYNALIGDFGKSGQFVGDLDGSGKVDIFDYNIFVTNYAVQSVN